MIMMISAGRTLTFLAATVASASSFTLLSPTTAATTTTSGHIVSTARYMSAETDTTLAEKKKGSSTTSAGSQQLLRAPTTWDEMVRQAASAIKEAASQGKTRQIVRILLPRDAASGDFGKYVEEETTSGSESDLLQKSILVPPDESWQGGIMQLYRAAAPTCSAMMRKITEDAQSGLPPRIQEDRSVDESGVDGVGLFQTSDDSVFCWLQPTQEIIDNVVNTCEEKKEENNGEKDQLHILLNPQWRTVDDALDSASQEEGFLGGLASFLGGKGGTLKRLAETGFTPVYTLEGYICRGYNVRLLQTLDSDWAVFCERSDGSSFIPVGTSPSRPSYQQVDEMLERAGIQRNMLGG